VVPLAPGSPATSLSAATAICYKRLGTTLSVGIRRMLIKRRGCRASKLDCDSKLAEEER
jgi:hypothetical protein